ncbi:BrnT family toxin [Candidatus Riflebacteria bacterium]
MDLEELLKCCEGFDWDDANREKNWQKHGITHLEAEELFFNIPVLVSPDKKHSKKEMRFYTLGKTNSNRWLFIVFTVRKNLIRVISARDMTGKERRVYEKEDSRI